jgi:cyclin-C
LEITRHILYLYDMWKTYDEKDQMKELLGKIPKPRLSQANVSSRPPQHPHHQLQQETH